MKTSHRVIIALSFAASVAVFVYFSGGQPSPLSATEETKAPLGPLRSVLSAVDMQDLAVSWVDTIVEIPRGSGIKYKYDEKTGGVQYERALPPNVQFPGEYGVVPYSLSGDGEPLEVIIVGQLPTFPGVLMQARPIGLIRMKIAPEQHDDKVIALPALDPSFDDIKDLSDLPLDMREEVAGFFRTFTNLDGSQAAVLGWGSAQEAQMAVLQARSAYARK